MVDLSSELESVEDCLRESGGKASEAKGSIIIAPITQSLTATEEDGEDVVVHWVTEAENWNGPKHIPVTEMRRLST